MRSAAPHRAPSPGRLSLPLLSRVILCDTMQLEHVFAILLYVIIFGSPVWVPLAIYLYHQRKNPPVKVMSIEELLADLSAPSSAVFSAVQNHMISAEGGYRERFRRRSRSMKRESERSDSNVGSTAITSMWGSRT